MGSSHKCPSSPFHTLVLHVAISVIPKWCFILKGRLRGLSNNWFRLFRPRIGHKGSSCPITCVSNSCNRPEGSDKFRGYLKRSTVNRSGAYLVRLVLQLSARCGGMWGWGRGVWLGDEPTLRERESREDAARGGDWGTAVERMNGHGRAFCSSLTALKK